jgi:hypothetical protein
MSLLSRLRGFFRRSAELADPDRSDVRFVAAEPVPAKPRPDARAHEEPPPEGAHPQPDAKEIGKEHRGY